MCEFVNTCKRGHTLSEEANVDTPPTIWRSMVYFNANEIEMVNTIKTFKMLTPFHLGIDSLQLDS